MSAIAIGALTFGLSFGGALAAMQLRALLPERHLRPDSRDTVIVAIGLVATMTALLLGLVTASARSSFDALDTAIKHAAQYVVVLDRVLARYGAETRDIRAALKDVFGRRVDRLWPRDRSPSAVPTVSEARAAEEVADRIRGLSPSSAVQRGLQARATDLAETVLAVRWQASGPRGTSIPALLLGALLLWLTMTFGGFGLFAPCNATVIAVLGVCAFSVASAIFLILEMDGAFDGLIAVSAEPLRFAHAQLNQ